MVLKTNLSHILAKMGKKYMGKALLVLEFWGIEVSAHITDDVTGPFTMQSPI